MNKGVNETKRDISNKMPFFILILFIELLFLWWEIKFFHKNRKSQAIGLCVDPFWLRILKIISLYDLLDSQLRMKECE